MRVLITGGTGYVGSHIVLELLKSGDEVTILARNPHKVPAFQDFPGISFVKGGLDDIDLIRESLPGHDACIHNAVYWAEDIDDLELRDLHASVAIFEASAKANVQQLIYTSSTAVHRPFRSDMNEEARLQTMDYYGATKAAAEVFLSAVSHQYGMRCNVIRPGPVIGPPALEGVAVKCHQRFGEFVQAAKRNEDICVSEGDGRQFIGVGDLAKLYLAVLRSEANRQIYLGVARTFTTWAEIAAQIIGAVGSESKVVAQKSGSEPPTFDVSKMERELGFAFESKETMSEHVRHLANLTS